MERDELAARHSRARGNPSSLRLVDSGHRTQVANLRYWRRGLQTCTTGDAGYKPALLETRVADVYNWRRRLQTCATAVNSLGQGETSGRLTTASVFASLSV